MRRSLTNQANVCAGEAADLKSEGPCYYSCLPPTGCSLVYSTDHNADVFEILPHIRFQVLGRRIGFQVGEPREPDIPDGLHDGRKLNIPFPKIMRIIFQMHLANTIFA